MSDNNVHPASWLYGAGMGAIGGVCACMFWGESSLTIRVFIIFAWVLAWWAQSRCHLKPAEEAKKP